MAARGGAGFYKTPLHGRAAHIERASRQGAGGSGLTVRLDLKPLAGAIKMIGDDKLPRGQTVSRGINRGLEKFRSAAHNHLKTLTKIRKPTRLKKGVTLIRSNASNLTGQYVIRDRHISITRAYFGARYSRHGIAGAQARWTGSASPAGATWTSWDGTRTGKSTFMLKGKSPVFIRLRPAKRFPIRRVFGPNPAEIIRLNLPLFQRVLKTSAEAYVQKAIERAYRQSEAKAKRAFGL